MDVLLASGVVWGAGFTDTLVVRGLGLAELGVAYLFFIANVLTTGILFLASRGTLVISPNRATRDYGLYVAAIVFTLFVATMLENELLPAGTASLHYAAAPHLLALFVLHLWIYYRQEPWLVGLGVSCIAGVMPVVLAAGIMTDAIRAAHLLALGLICLLLGFVWVRAISTKRGFFKARSIYIGSKEDHQGTLVLAPQKPWLGLPQCVALVCASLLLAAMNELLRGSAITAVPATQVLSESLLLLAATALVSAVPAATYWLARKTWMPELTRFVWLVWLVVGFAFTYGNFLLSLERA
jgi:hypothetical protein